MRVEINSNVIPTSFLKIEERVRLFERKTGERRQLVELAEILKHFPGANKGEKEGRKGDVAREATAGGAMEKSWPVTVIERKDVKKDYLIEYFLPTGIGNAF